MGEYAKRNSDNAKIKIGTCESMYYLRYSDRHQVTPVPHSLNPQTATGLFWRLPFPDEDHIQPGDYDDYKRGLLLREGNRWFTDESLAEHPGRLQMSHPSGLLLSVPCFHGVKLPSVGDDVTIHWNGKNPCLELIAIKNTATGIFPIVACRYCESMWRYEWDEILPYIPDPELCRRLAHYKSSIAA